MNRKIYKRSSISYIMNNSINKTLKEMELIKTSAISITLSNKILKDIEKEQEKLNIKSRSKIIELIMVSYFQSKNK